ncbi:MAG TPA: Lrp/AsnC family transcriptional regulator [Bacteroidia bacterium]|jgi:Lrp/AsnC family leucine-responsive transcriptional regulator|nr:Lrp/AsnC family transcriptional regulator [Bacteroidia bacterium]
MKLDETDIKLINLLQEDCKQPIKDLSQKLNLSVAPIHERIKKLEKNGIIKRYVAIIDIGLVNKPLINYCNVSINRHTSEKFIEFESSIRAMDEVLECYYISGNSDFLLKVISANMDEYQNFILNKLAKLDIISNINTQFVLRHVKFKTSINV